MRTAAVELNGYLRSLGFPRVRGALFVGEYTTMADRMANKFTEEMSDLGEIKVDKTNLWHFRFFDRSMGMILLRNLEKPEKSRGAELDYALVDELTEHTRKTYGDILYMVRSSRGLPFKSFGAATNPDGIGHTWVKKLWIEKKFGDEPKAFQKTAGDYVYIPYKPQDNPTFDEDIAATLQSHPDPMIVKARWEGSWDLLAGTRFSQFRREVHVYEDELFWRTYSPLSPHAADVGALLRDSELFTIYGSLDYGTDLTSATAFHLHAVDFKGRVWTFGELYLRGMFLRDQAEAIQAYVERWGLKLDAREFERGIDRIYCDPALLQRDSDGISRYDKFRNYGLRMVLGNNSRVEGWATMDELLFMKRVWDPETLTETLLGEPIWRIHESCEELIGQITSAPRDANNPEDISKKFKTDHALDGTRYFCHSHFKGAPELIDPIEFGSVAWLQRLHEQDHNGQHHGYGV